MMHCHSPLCKVVGFIVFLLLSLTAIAVGLTAFNYDVMNMPLFQTHLKTFIRPLYIAIGISGLIGLLALLGLGGTSKCMYCRKCRSCEGPAHSHNGPHTK